jgi:uncharacterized protein (DUF427 family)
MDEESRKRMQGRWLYRGRERPAWATSPQPGQESVWDYPRPPIVVDDHRHIEIRFADTLIAATDSARRVLETGSPPTVYLPPTALQVGCLWSDSRSFCEWKGLARYFGVRVGHRTVSHAGWCYPQPCPPFQDIGGYLAFYPARVECYVDDERVLPQPGGFYGGWVTAEIVGPFKGGPGTADW